jgi:DNA-binding NarL/FixJ family response regulator
MNKSKQQLTRVVLADDHDAVRSGIKSLLRPAHDIVVVGEAKNGEDTLKTVNELSPDVLLLDIEMPGMNGIGVARQIKDNRQDTRVLVLSAYDDQEYIEELMTLGVSGYLVKGEAPKKIIEAIRGVARGEKGWLSPQIAKKILGKEEKTNPAQKTLTFLELRILRQMAERKSDQEISTELDLDRETVTKQVQSILAKLNAASRDEAVTEAIKQGWV